MKPLQQEPAPRACEMPTCWCPQGREHDEPWGPPGTDEDTRAWHITVDHIVPLFEGGPNTAANKRPAHRLCNRIDATIRLGQIPKKDMARIARANAAAAARQFDLLAQVKSLAKVYREATGRPLGVTGEVAEYEAARLLGLTLAPVRHPSFDAERTNLSGGTDRLQIKGRCILSGASRSQQIGGIKLTGEWEAVLLVLLDDHLETTAIYEADLASVREALERPGSRARNDRGALSVAKFKAIGWKVWPLAGLNPPPIPASEAR